VSGTEHVLPDPSLHALRPALQYGSEGTHKLFVGIRYGPRWRHQTVGLIIEEGPQIRQRELNRYEHGPSGAKEAPSVERIQGMPTHTWAGLNNS
jgi:hypothetical protein